VTQISHRVFAERALALEGESVRAEYLEDGTYVLKVSRPRRTVDEDVVEEDEDETAKERLQDTVHQGLERRWRICGTERYDDELEVAMVGAEGRLGDVLRVHGHLVVPTAQVEFGEEARTFQFVKELIDHGDREFVLNGLGVEDAIVDAEAPAAILLPHKQHCR